MFHFKKVTSEVIDNLKYINKYDEYEGTAYINGFQKSCAIVIKNQQIEYAEKCIRYLNHDMPTSVFQTICQSLIKYYYQEKENNEDVQDTQKLKEEDILHMISDVSIIISKPKSDTIGFVITGNCDWNEEHGFAVVIENNQVKYVGENDNTFDPWDNYQDVGFAVQGESENFE